MDKADATLRESTTLGDLCRSYIQKHKAAIDALNNAKNPCVSNVSLTCGQHLGAIIYTSEAIKAAMGAMPGKWTEVRDEAGIPWFFGERTTPVEDRNRVDADAIVIMRRGW